MGRQKGYRHKYRPTNPYRHPQTSDLRVVLYMDDETYAECDAAAKANNCSLSSQVRLFLEIGIETIAMEKAAAQ